MKKTLVATLVFLLSNQVSFAGVLHYNSGGSGGSGTVTSVGLSDGSTAPIFTITGSPVVGAGTLTETLNTEPKNTVLSGPATGANAQPTFRALVGADLPLPAVSTLGGSFSKAVVSHNFLTGISSVDGSVSAAQPACGDISNAGTSCTATAYVLPVAAAGTIGGVFSKAAITHDFLTSISSVDGSIGQAQPAFIDISGVATGAQLPLPAVATLGGVFSKALVTHNFLTSISSVDGSIGQARPTCGDLSDSSTGCTTTVGTAATQNTGTSGANVPLLNGANTWGAAQALGSSTATTQAANDNSTKVATTAYADRLRPTAGQIVGTATNDNATAGNVGEYIESLCFASGGATVTISIASPAVITDSAALSIGCTVTFTTSGALPTGITVGTNYYIIPAGFNSGVSYEIATTPFGAAINTSGSQSGIQSRSAVANIATDTLTTVAAIQLTAGDWQCDANSIFATSGITTGIQSWLGTTNNSSTGLLRKTLFTDVASLGTGVTATYSNSSERISLSGTTNYYLVEDESFSTGTGSGYGNIGCRRMR